MADEFQTVVGERSQLAGGYRKHMESRQLSDVFQPRTASKIDCSETIHPPPRQFQPYTIDHCDGVFHAA